MMSNRKHVIVTTNHAARRGQVDMSMRLSGPDQKPDHRGLPSVASVMHRCHAIGGPHMGTPNTSANDDDKDRKAGANGCRAQGTPQRCHEWVVGNSPTCSKLNDRRC